MHPLKAQRKAQKLTLRDLSLRTHISISMLNRLENRQRKLTEAYLRRLAKALSCTIADLVTPEEEPVSHA